MPIYIHRDGEKLGPYTEMQAQQHLQDGALLPQDLAWRHGEAGWGPLSGLLMPVAVPTARVLPAVAARRPWWRDLMRLWTKRK
jgi:hypothetical protein